MNVLKIQQEVLKDALSDKGQKWMIEVTENEVFIGSNCMAYSLPHNEYLLDTEKLKSMNVRADNVTIYSKCFSEAGNAKPAYRTGVLKKIKDKYTVIELCCEKDLIYLDEKLLKYFDKSAEFEVTTPKSPVFVYEEDVLVGLVLPVNVKA